MWSATFVMGFALALLGAFCVWAAAITGLVSILTLGVILIAGGVVEGVHAFRTRGRGGTAEYALSALFTIVLGVLFVVRPTAGLAAISLVLAVYFFGSGLFRTVMSAGDRYPHWGWDFLYGVSGIVLGALIMARWPISSLWIVGTLVGIEIFMRGVAIIAASLVARRVLRRGQSYA